MTFLRQVRDGNLQSYVRRAGDADNLLHFGSGFTERISIHISFADLVNQHEINLEPAETDSLYPHSEFVYSWDRVANAELPYEERLFSHGNEATINDRDGISYAPTTPQLEAISLRQYGPSLTNEENRPIAQ